jgi:protein-tyrosine phosphatase
MLSSVTGAALRAFARAEGRGVHQVPGYPLWLGHAGEAGDLRRLYSTGILAVVDLALNEPPAAPGRDLAYLRFPLVDGPGNQPWLLRGAVEAVAGLLRSGTPTLVSCSNGLSRAPCIAGAALALARNCPPAEGLALVARSGPADVSPGLWAEVEAVEPLRREPA